MMMQFLEWLLRQKAILVMLKERSVITGLDAISNDAYVYHAGTAKNDGGQFVLQWWSCATCCSKRSGTSTDQLRRQKYIKKT